MAQLFDRIRNYLRAELNADLSNRSDTSDLLDWSDQSDAELRAAIDALEASPLAQAAAVLGIQPTSSLQDAHAAWRRGIADVHPDRLTTADAATQKAAAQKLHALNSAYELFRRHYEHHPNRK